MSQPHVNPRHTTIDQDARVAFEAYRNALHLAFPSMPWERLPAATQHAWQAVVLALRTQAKEETP